MHTALRVNLESPAVTTVYYRNTRSLYSNTLLTITPHLSLLSLNYCNTLSSHITAMERETLKIMNADDKEQSKGHSVDSV